MSEAGSETQAAGTGRKMIGFIGGSGFEDALEAELGAPAASNKSIVTKHGDVSVAIYGSPAGNAIAFLPRHGIRHGVAPHLINHHANIAAFSAIGCRAILSTTAVGSLRREFKPGDFAVPDDFIDMRGGLPTTRYESLGEVVHTEFSQPFSEAARGALIQSLADVVPDFDLPGTIIHPRAVTLCVSGPRYETPAEVRCFAAWGGDLVGMTVVPEAILARESGLEYATLSVITNYGTGLSPDPPAHGDVEAMMRARRGCVVAAILRACDSLASRW